MFHMQYISIANCYRLCKYYTYKVDIKERGSMLITDRFRHMFSDMRTAVGLLLGAVLVALAVAVLHTAPANAQVVGSGALQVATGANTACAVKDNWAYCWGSNDHGMLGIGRTDGGKNRSTPVKVADNKDAIPADKGLCNKKNWLGQCTGYARQPAPAQPASAMHGYSVTKVSVGKTHACAIADARVFCWGDNSKGQLGNRTHTDSIAPVAVDISQKDVVPAPVTNKPCGGWFQPQCKTTQPPTQAKSALGAQEAIDVVAGEYFTCALTSEGTVACWGEGDDGRLGTGNTKDSNFPVAVYSGADSVLKGKRGVKLSKASAKTTCVLAVPQDSTLETLDGNPYCWGYGMGTGTIPTGKGSSTTKCSKTSPRQVPAGSSKSTYFDGLKPVAVSDTKLFGDAVANNYVTGLGADKNVYIWGMNGHEEVTEYTNVSSCVIRSCTGFSPAIQLAGYTSNSRTTTQKNSTGGTTKNTNHYSGRATPGTKATAWKPDYDGCRKQNETHYGFTKVHKFVKIGSVTPVTPSSLASSSRTNISLVAGDASGGLFCSGVPANVACDANGSSMEEGQTGSNYTKQCTTKTVLFIFKSTTCQPAPKGPQSVDRSGWLAGKTIDSISTSATGFSCAISDGGVGCWGVNGRGQLGVGDTNNRNVPVAVKL
jgi:alpha-tubulin suppressor-like RCC1 family protein